MSQLAQKTPNPTGLMMKAMGLGAFINAGGRCGTNVDRSPVSSIATDSRSSGLRISEETRDDELVIIAQQDHLLNQVYEEHREEQELSVEDFQEDFEEEQQQQQQHQTQERHHHHRRSNKKAPISSSSSHLSEGPVDPHLSPVPKLLIEDVLSDDAKFAEDAVDRLARRCRKSSEVRLETYLAGGHAIIVMVMRKWRNNEIIQANCCRCITFMTVHLPEAKLSFAMIGGVESVVYAMKLYPDSLQVQCFACGALMNLLLAAVGDNPEVCLNMAERFVLDMDGVAVVVRSMKKFPKDAKIQLGGCGLFQNLAQHKAFISPMMQAGAVAAVGAALESHPADANVRGAAGSFMKKVFSSS